jgi:hypothetical protein
MLLELLRSIGGFEALSNMAQAANGMMVLPHVSAEPLVNTGVSNRGGRFSLFGT